MWVVRDTLAGWRNGPSRHRDVFVGKLARMVVEIDDPPDENTLPPYIRRWAIWTWRRDALVALAVILWMIASLLMGLTWLIF